MNKPKGEGELDTGACLNTNERPVNLPTTSDLLRLAQVTSGFEALVAACPRDLAPRQRVLTRREPNFLFVEIRTTFKIAINSLGYCNGKF